MSFSRRARSQQISTRAVIQDDAETYQHCSRTRDIMIRRQVTHHAFFREPPRTRFFSGSTPSSTLVQEMPGTRACSVAHSQLTRVVLRLVDLCAIATCMQSLSSPPSHGKYILAGWPSATTAYSALRFPLFLSALLKIRLTARAALKLSRYCVVRCWGDILLLWFLEREASTVRLLMSHQTSTTVDTVRQLGWDGRGHVALTRLG